MQLDNTSLVIRERSQVDILDLALQVIRRYLGPLLQTFALGALPFIVLNEVLTGWMLTNVAFDDPWDLPGRYLWAQMVLVFLEAQWASALVTYFLGRAVFLEKPRLRDMVRDVLKMSWPLFLVQGILRCAVPALVMYGFVWHTNEIVAPTEIVLMTIFCLVAAGVRAFRPFATEIVVLERNKLTSSNRNVITVGRRSAALHGPSSGDLFSRWLGSVLVATLGFALVFASLYTTWGFLMFHWQLDRVNTRILFPLALWIIVFYFAVVRFLSYLDLRIRQEGWEVELRIRAEAARLIRNPL